MKSYFSKFTATLFLAILLCVMLPPFQFKAFTNTSLTVTPGWPASLPYRNYGNMSYDFSLSHTSTNPGSWGVTCTQGQIMDSAINSYFLDLYQKYDSVSAYLDMAFQCDMNFTVNSSAACDIMVYFLGYDCYSNFDITWNSPISLDVRDVYNPEPSLVLSYHYDGGTSPHTFLLRPFCRSRLLFDINFSSFGGSLASLVQKVSYTFLPKFRIVVSSTLQQTEYQVILSNYQFVFYPIFSNRNSDNTYNYTYLKPFSPYSIPDFRFIDALQHIWSAINGGDSVGNLSDDIKQQTQDITQGFTDKTADNANTTLRNNLTQVDLWEERIGDGTIGYFDEVSNGFDDSFADDALTAMSFFKSTTQTLLNHTGLFSALVVSAITFFVIAVVAGVRRFI